MDSNIKMFDIVTIQGKTYALFRTLKKNFQITLVCVNTKKHYKHRLTKRRSEYSNFNIESPYIQNNFWYIHKQFITKKDDRIKIGYFLKHMTSIDKVETLELPKYEYKI